MNNQKAPPFATEGTRSLLKTQYKKIYSICRLFTNNYKEHQRLFADIIAATAQSIRRSGGTEEKNTLLLQACVNMAALHSMTREMEASSQSALPTGQTGRTISGSTVIRTMTGPRRGPLANPLTGDCDNPIQFKSPDYQKSMIGFRSEMGDLTDYQKILLFLNFEKVPTGEVPRLSGLPVMARTGNDQSVKKSLIPYLKEN